MSFLFSQPAPGILPANSVDFSEVETISANRILGNNLGVESTIQELQVSDVATMLNLAQYAVGPASSIANSIPLFSDNNGKILVDNSGWVIVGSVLRTLADGNGKVGSNTTRVGEAWFKTVLNLDSLTASTILKADASNNIVSLANGLEGQVLKIVSGVPSWSTDAMGMSNPMTTAGDIIVGGVGGTATRLGLGTVDKVLVSDGATVSYQYAGLGAGSLGTGNIIVGAAKPGVFTSTNNVLITTTPPSLRQGSGFNQDANICIGYNPTVSGNFTRAAVAIGSNNTVNGEGAVAIGTNVASTLGVGIGSTAASGATTIGLNASSGISGVHIGSSNRIYGNYTVAVGAGSNAYSNGSYITAVGYYAGRSSIASSNYSSYSNSVYLGAFAGTWSDNVSNELFIDNQNRTSYGLQQTNSLMYGTFNATASSQTLTINAATTSTYGFIANEIGGNFDTRIEGDTDQNLVFVDASTDRVGIGTATPQEKLDVDTGNLRVSNGDCILNTAGNGLKIKTGSDATAGLATITNGTAEVTVTTNKCFTTSIILVTNNTSTAYVSVTTKNNGSFKIAHNNNVGADQECAWFIINPA